VGNARRTQPIPRKSNHIAFSELQILEAITMRVKKQAGSMLYSGGKKNEIYIHLHGYYSWDWSVDYLLQHRGSKTRRACEGKIMMQKSQIQQNYDKIARVFDCGERSLGRLLLGRLKRKFLKEARGRVFEVAIGTGSNLPYYPPNCQIYGIDLSLGMLKMAQKRAERIGYPVISLKNAQHLAGTPVRARQLAQAGVHAISSRARTLALSHHPLAQAGVHACGGREAIKNLFLTKSPVFLLMMDAENLAFPDNCFDTVVCTLSLCTIPDPIQALREMGRVLKPGGKILILEHVSTGGKYFKKFQSLFARHFYERFGCHLERQTVNNVRIAGLEIKRLQYHFWSIVVLIEAIIPDKF